MKPQPKNRAGALLLCTDRAWRWAGIDRGIDWIASTYVIARADIFHTAPDVGEDRNLNGALRKILDGHRSQPPLGRAFDSEFRTVGRDGKTEVALLRRGWSYIPVNARCYNAWQKTGLECWISHSGGLLWRGKVRGKYVLFGVLMPMHLGTWRNFAQGERAA